MTTLTDDSSTIEYDFVGDADSSITLPRNPVILLPNETVHAEVLVNLGCELVTDLSNQAQVRSQSDNIHIVEILNLSQTSSEKGTNTGTIGCLDRPMTYVSLDWRMVNHRLHTETLEATVAWEEPSTVELHPDSIGDGPRIYTISVDGPAGRISDSITTGTYYPGDPIVLAIEPDGLLEPRMIARGELVICLLYTSPSPRDS